MTWYDQSQREARGRGYAARHPSSPLRMQTRPPVTQRTKAARRGAVFLVVSFLAPLAVLGVCMASAGDRGKGDLGRVERQEYLWTGDSDLSSESTVDPADPASLPAPTAAGPVPTPTAAGCGTTGAPTDRTADTARQLRR
ncbi:hypothetical protein GCM10010429_10340 [Micromonospora olivasterospora]|uniref:Uncharacterized protein n=1 Tax=Micromonospora olivasterospora TaxID=1880 RepID=A0A562IJ37_MICOL|nr:hypothetical protein JD77_05760 [Micromonospora olivasterospora]